MDHSDPFVHFGAFRGMKPIAIENYVVCALCGNQTPDVSVSGRDPFQTDKAIVISDVGSRRRFDDERRHEFGSSAGGLGVSGPPGRLEIPAQAGEMRVPSGGNFASGVSVLIVT